MWSSSLSNLGTINTKPAEYQYANILTGVRNIYEYNNTGPLLAISQSNQTSFGGTWILLMF